MKAHYLAAAAAIIVSSPAIAIEVNQPKPKIYSPTTSPTAQKRTIPAETQPAPAYLPPPAPTSNAGRLYMHVGFGATQFESNDIDALGFNNADVQYEVGFSGKVGVGYRGETGLGFEFFGEYGETYVDEAVGIAASGDVNHYAAIASLYFSPSAGVVEPKIGIGAGVFHAEWFDVQSQGVQLIDDDATGLALEGQAGLMFRVAPNFAIGPTYRYRYVKDVPIDDAYTTMHIGEVSMQIAF